MPRIDAHQHFWQYQPVRDAWIDESMKVIRRDFYPRDLEPLLKASGLDGSVVVQSASSEEENDFQLDNARRHPFVRGVVGWVDLLSPGVEGRLQYYQQFPLLKGFRHVLQGEAHRDFMLRPDFMRGVGLLERYGFSYDILVYMDQLEYTVTFARAFPGLGMVLDHLGKPDFRAGSEQALSSWVANIRALAALPNVCCKVSGMVTEAHWDHWTPGDFRFALDTVTEAFGTNRLMYGSDWPVCLVAGDYAQVKGIVDQYFTEFSASEREAVFGGNASRFYRIT